jgi:putative tricarboxylic transport membrane protein
MKKSYIINDIVLILFSVFICIGSLRLKQGIGTLQGPGPGFMPFFAGMILGLLSLVDFISQWRSKEDPQRESAGVWASVRWKKLLPAVCFLFLYTALMERLGFSLSTLLYLLSFYRLAGVESWRINVLISIGTTVVFYVGFKILLECQLPRGFLGF